MQWTSSKRGQQRSAARAAAEGPTWLRRAVLTKLNAAKGGGFIFQSDHSVPSNVSGQRYDEVVRLVREHGRYPLRLGEFDLPDIS